MGRVRPNRPGTGTLGGMTPSLIPLVAAAEEHHRELPLPSIAFGLIAIACFLILLAFVWSFRNNAADRRPQSGGEHGQGQGH